MLANAGIELKKRIVATLFWRAIVRLRNAIARLRIHEQPDVRERDHFEVRVKEIQKEFEAYRYSIRSTPESSLREEISRLKAQLAESKAEIERERRIRSENELEKEYYRSQLQKLATILKRERERSTSLAREDVESLRMQFLAKEEKYILDGDRTELRNIKNELYDLRNKIHYTT
jgi:hypothetical protein